MSQKRKDRLTNNIITWFCYGLFAVMLAACGTGDDDGDYATASALPPSPDPGPDPNPDPDPVPDPVPDPDPDPVPDPDPDPDPSTAKAFPGAEGFGAYSQGGRGGDVKIVTNLGDSGVGSLRWAIEQAGPRTVVFEVSGVIPLQSELAIDSPWITIAGQSSPAGITLSGGRLKIRTHNVIIRGLRVRPGDSPGGMDPGDRDGFSIGSLDSPVRDIIIDHSSMTWAVDENGSNWYPNENVTVQWCIFAEGLRNSIHPEGPHSMGYLVGPASQKISLHHNVFASNDHRNPVVKEAQAVELINNVGYNWRSEGIAVLSTGSTTMHAINNYYLHGPDTTLRPSFYLRQGQHRIYLNGNIDSTYRPSAATGDEWDVAHGWSAEMRSDDPVFEQSGVTTHETLDLLSVVLQGAGAITPLRDPIDARIIDSIVRNTGRIIDSPAEVGGYDIVTNVIPSADTDRDGMPDVWEIDQQLNPNDAEDRNSDQDNDGYTALEEYLNALIE